MQAFPPYAASTSLHDAVHKEVAQEQIDFIKRVNKVYLVIQCHDVRKNPPFASTSFTDLVGPRNKRKMPQHEHFLAHLISKNPTGDIWMIQLLLCRSIAIAIPS